MADHPADSVGQSEGALPARIWALRGMRWIFSAPAFILLSSMVGFGGFARESGWTVGETAFMTATIWALPNQVVMIGALAGGGSIATAAVAVCFAAVRLLPMTVALMPIMRGGAWPRWIYYPLSHFVAVTAWVVAMHRLPDLPPQARVPYFAGFAISLAACAVGAVTASHLMAGALPPLFAGALFFLTPIYFMTSLALAARVRADYLGLAFGLVLGPLAHYWAPELDVLIAGIIGGTAAYFLARAMGSRPG